MSTITDPRQDELRRMAIERLEKRAAFWPHLVAYVLVNALLVAAWMLLADGGFFWPVFPMIGWGIGVFFHAWDVFHRPPTQDRIDREIQRLTDQPER